MAKKHKLVLSDEAAVDLDSIFDPLFSAILKRLLLLQHHPEMGLAMSGPYAGMRTTPVGIFRIFYRIKKQVIEVVYVRHCKRQMPNP